MKTIIFALDALELTLIDLWRLDEFKQKNFGSYEVVGLEALSTPICFSAILTGKNPSTYGYTLSYLTQNLEQGYPTWLQPLVWVRKRFLRNVKSLGMRRKARTIGLFEAHSRNMTEDQKNLTVLMRLESEGYTVRTDNVPSYDEDAQANFRGRMIHLIGKGFEAREEHVEELLIATRDRWLRNLEVLDSHDLTFIYSPLPDIAHHLVHHEMELMLLERVYRSLIDLPLLFELKDVAVLILSDHGYLHEFDETGKDISAEHSHVGFWSLNVDTEVVPTTIFDFSELIYHLVTT
ncbi:MAG: hypothetical protein JSV27_09060 [Candidatus Bathyarchaeota archaeon]|nr:MAG: hypothetical protein JSV27_09060 [Candidatus Bathyarchaeota archaeon]